METRGRFCILLVEDNPGDVVLIQEALEEGAIDTQLVVAEDGVEALALLRRQGPYAQARRPDLILLDLNLPRTDGREVLASVKSDKQLCRIPVVVLTTSKADEDVLRTYDLHANCYITKPVGMEEFIRVVKMVESFWLKLARLPGR